MWSSFDGKALRPRLPLLARGLIRRSQRKAAATSVKSLKYEPASIFVFPRRRRLRYRRRDSRIQEACFQLSSIFEHAYQDRVHRFARGAQSVLLAYTVDGWRRRAHPNERHGGLRFDPGASSKGALPG